MSTTPLEYYGLGKRKTSVARVHMRPGAGEIQFALKRINEEVGFGTPPEAGAETLVSEATAILARG